jgi:hypothetical protein
MTFGKGYFIKGHLGKMTLHERTSGQRMFCKMALSKIDNWFNDKRHLVKCGYLVKGIKTLGQKTLG